VDAERKKLTKQILIIINTGFGSGNKETEDDLRAGLNAVTVQQTQQMTMVFQETVGKGPKMCLKFLRFGLLSETDDILDKYYNMGLKQLLNVTKTVTPLNQAMCYGITTQYGQHLICDLKALSNLVFCFFFCPNLF
jgi:hypothetical protein